MKIRRSAIINQLKINDQIIDIPDLKGIELELSALDTGSRYQDPMLDFSFNLESIPDGESVLNDLKKPCTLTIQDPSDKSHQCTISTSCEISRDGGVEINGRIKEDNLSSEVIGFVIKLRN